MSKRTIPAAMRRSLVAEARGRCAYCRTPTAISGARLVVDHIVPEALGGPTELENLCLACHCCNEFKGVQVSSQDPVSRRVVALFHPRRHRWSDHFRWSPDGKQKDRHFLLADTKIVVCHLPPNVLSSRRTGESGIWWLQAQ